MCEAGSRPLEDPLFISWPSKLAFQVTPDCRLIRAKQLPQSIIERFADRRGGGCITLREAFVVSTGVVIVFDLATGRQIRRLPVPFDVFVWWPQLTMKNSRVYTADKNELHELSGDHFSLVCQTRDAIESFIILEHTRDTLTFYYQSGSSLNLVTRKIKKNSRGESTRKKKVREECVFSGIALLLGTHEGRVFAFTRANNFVVIQGNVPIWKFAVRGVLKGGAVCCGPMVYWLVQNELFVVNTASRTVTRMADTPPGSLVVRETTDDSTV